MQFRIVLLSLLAIFSSEVQYAMGTPRNPTPQCDPGEENDCSRCFDVLVNQVVVNDRNRYNLQRAFFPPNVANPVFVEVTYYFTRNASGNGSTDYSNTSISEVWYWTESTFYLIQPIQSLQFTSLLFSDISLRRETLVLYLQPDCYQENDTERDLRMQLFTQRMKLYAMKQSIAAQIDNLYNPKAESINTLRQFYAGNAREFGNVVSGYSFFFQLFFPIVALACFCVLMSHIFHYNKLRDLRKYFKTSRKSSNKPPDDPDFSSRNLYILMACIGSSLFMLYVLSLDCCAMGFRENQHEPIFFVRGNMYRHDSFVLEYIVPIFMFIYDFVLMIFLVVFISLKQCCKVNAHWYFVFLAPISSVIVHSYHIIVSFIHTLYHASSIFILYAILFFVYVIAFRSTYFCLPSMCKVKPRLCTMVCCLSALSVFVFVILTLIVVLFIFVPINLAIDDAPSRLFSLNQTIVFLLSVGVAYKLFYTRKVDELVNMLVETQDTIEEIEDVASYEEIPNFESGSTVHSNDAVVNDDVTVNEDTQPPTTGATPGTPNFDDSEKGAKTKSEVADPKEIPNLESGSTVHSNDAVVNDDVTVNENTQPPTTGATPGTPNFDDSEKGAKTKSEVADPKEIPNLESGSTVHSNDAVVNDDVTVNENTQPPTTGATPGTPNDDDQSKKGANSRLIIIRQPITFSPSRPRPNPDYQLQVPKIKNWSMMERSDKERHMKKRLLQIVHSKTSPSMY